MYYRICVRDLSTLYGESVRELRPEVILVLRPAPEMVDSAPVIDLQAVEVAGPKLLPLIEDRGLRAGL